jgi:hypothetical protein
MPDDRPLDGQNVWDIVTGKNDKRTRAIPFRFADNNAPGLSLLKGQYRYYTNFDTDDPRGDMLYDFFADRGEEKNLISDMPELAAEMRREAMEFLVSCRKSYEGRDYPTGSTYEPLGPWHEMKNRVWSGPNAAREGRKKNKRAGPSKDR